MLGHINAGCGGKVSKQVFPCAHFADIRCRWELGDPEVALIIRVGRFGPRTAERASRGEEELQPSRFVLGWKGLRAIEFSGAVFQFT